MVTKGSQNAFKSKAVTTVARTKNTAEKASK